MKKLELLTATGAAGMKTEAVAETLAKRLSGSLELEQRDVFLVLAAGHGKRLRSSLPKVMHPMWGVPSLSRVIAAAEAGLDTRNQLIVVGKQADEVVAHVGSAPQRVFAYQAVLNGTGHAVQMGLQQIPEDYAGTLYTLPGDMGLLDAELLRRFRETFARKRPAMMLLTGWYDGAAAQNYYGRVVCVPERTRAGKLVAEAQRGKVLAILQYQDLKAMPKTQELVFSHLGEEFSFTAGEILATRRFDAGVFAFELNTLRQHLFALGTDNIQQELYLTDLVMHYNQHGLMVECMVEENAERLLGFNDKTVWRKMESVFRRRYYEQLRNIVNIEDEERFYVHERVVEWIVTEDAERGPLDLTLGSGVSIGADVLLAKGVELGANVKLSGELVLGEGVYIGAGTVVSAFSGQRVTIGAGVRLGGRNVIKGNISIAAQSRIGEGVNITGSTRYPTVIGMGAQLVGSCYLFGCHVAPGAQIESCILVKQQVKPRRVNGKIVPIQYIIPQPVGEEQLSDLPVK